MALSNKSQAAKRFDDLPQPNDLFLATYVWIDSFKLIRLKTRTFDYVPIRPTDLPIWDSVSMHAETYVIEIFLYFVFVKLFKEFLYPFKMNSDISLDPVRIFNDQFYPNGRNKLVLCETYKYDKTITG